MRKQNGITLIALVITIIVLMILSFSITINLAPHLNYRTKTNFNTDITQLKEEVEQYYIKNNIDGYFIKDGRLIVYNILYKNVSDSIIEQI